jgi:hypothetical protein
MNNLVNFELAQLLKENGYNEPTYDCYNLNGLLFSNGWCEYIADDYEFDGLVKPHKLKEKDVLAPTISEVVMWLYEKHNIWISVRINGIDKTFDYSIHDIENMGGSLDNIERSSFIKPSYAYQEAILYTLKNLI